MSRGLLLCAALGAVLTVLAALVAPGALARGWLAGALLVLGLGLGAIWLLLIFALTGGRWGEGARPLLHGMLLLVQLGLLALLPLLLVLPALFPWTAPAETLPETVRHKLAYLNVPFLLLRAAACAVVWLGLLPFVRRWTQPGVRAPGGGVSVALILHTLAVSVLSVDWMMSLEPDFVSTIYPMIEASAEATGALALALLLAALAAPVERMPGGEKDEPLGEDLANLLFGFLMAWGYMAFMQYLIVWAADLPDEIGWYLRRNDGGWELVVWLMLALHLVPGAALMWPRLKKTRPGLIALAALILAGHAVDVVWRIAPAGPGPGWAALGPVLLLGALGGALLTGRGLPRRRAAHAG
ncbi:hypothetical protein Rumeso_04534 [Rubellimicrobium mesophilum DSM 19309]|uniref:Uncharacterized protein n=1 Tax=Rubellimicrobium mesophilum DSM 19309 TaxID=442562 RepID=A0A017HHF7_9RHOB|nr:hypothetical protein [Rubellimicrobium mesophilum]EYD73937.1 hypothetical protein Rumeso_04534 [Rubellimicrobium mesophilum DSM 19309]